MKTILLIENDPAHLVAQSLLLRCFGHSVLEASNRGEAWFASRQYEGPIHLVLTKAIVDGYGSSEFIARLQLVYPQMHALFVCESSPAELTNLPGEHALLQKPFQLETLAYTIRELLKVPKKKSSVFPFVTDPPTSHGFS